MSAASRYGSGDTTPPPSDDSPTHYREAASPVRVAVLNAGGWGTALAILLAGNGHRVALWCRRAELAQEINRERVNPHYLPGVPIPGAVTATADLAEAVEGRRALV